MSHQVATIISRICDPFIMLGVTFVVVLYGSPVFIPSFISMVILPVILYGIAWKTKFISNWDISRRTERPKILWSFVAIEAVCAYVFHLSAVLPILLVLIGFTVITQFWKISGHAVSAGIASGTVVSHFGFAWWPVLLIVPMVGWARVVRRDHTIWQVTTGAIYSWGLLALLGKLFSV